MAGKDHHGADDGSPRWLPLSVRQGGGSIDHQTLRDDVPSWLEPSLSAWVTSNIRDSTFAPVGMLRTMERALRRNLDSNLFEMYQLTPGRGDEHLREKLISEGVLLDAADWLLAFLWSQDPWGVTEDGEAEASEQLEDLLQDLNLILEQAGSAWMARGDETGARLERRVPQEVSAAADLAIGTEDRPAEHLRAAWARTYGRKPDPGGAYRDAVRAVEAVAQPIVSPRNRKATLGTMIRDMLQKPEKWRVLLAPQGEDKVVQVVSMMDLLWKGQTDRHGSPDDTSPIQVSQAEAEAALHLAITLVHWFRTGVITAAPVVPAPRKRRQRATR